MNSYAMVSEDVRGEPEQRRRKRVRFEAWLANYDLRPPGSGRRCPRRLIGKRCVRFAHRRRRGRCGCERPSWIDHPTSHRTYFETRYPGAVTAFVAQPYGLRPPYTTEVNPLQELRRTVAELRCHLVAHHPDVSWYFPGRTLLIELWSPTVDSEWLEERAAAWAESTVCLEHPYEPNPKPRTGLDEREQELLSVRVRPFGEWTVAK
jgi:hypothetical protein